MIYLIVLSTITVALSILFYISKRKYDFWKKRGVPYEKPMLLFGNFPEYILLRKYQGQVMQALCRKHAREPYFGVFYGTEPTLVVQDPALVKLVTTKHFHHYTSREVGAYTHLETTTQNLFFTQGDRWKVLRQNLTSLFSSAKMRNMFHLIEKCCDAFEAMLDKEVKNLKDVDIRNTMVRYGMDCISSCAFGINSDVMGENSEKNQFKVIGDLIFESSTSRGAKMVARAVWPYIFYGLGFRLFPGDIDTFFVKLISEVIQGRNNKTSNRQDFIDLLMTFKQNKFLVGDSLDSGDTKKKFQLEVTDELLIAQCVTFFGAGFETSASTMSFTLFELAKHEEAQKKVQGEIDEYLKKTGGKVTYECQTQLPYLEACIDEALRLYPVLGVVTREVESPHELVPGLLLPRGLRIHLPVYHLHRSEEFFPNPDQYRPERFLPVNKKDIVPYSYMPFGEGPRICIGMRFAKMQMMAGMVTLLKRFRLRPAPGTPSLVDFEPRTFVTQPTRPLRLTLIPRSQSR